MRRMRMRRLTHEGHDHGPDRAAGPAPGGHTHSHQHTKQVLNRLSRITGHLNAVKTMVETGRDCSEVLVQLAAVQSALAGASRVLLKEHIEHCIVHAVQAGDQSAIEELNKAIKTLIRK